MTAQCDKTLGLLWECSKECGDEVPEPAVSVPRAKLTNPDPTATPEPEDDPPGMNLQSQHVGASRYDLSYEATAARTHAW